jgi:hypothetical protein
MPVNLVAIRDNNSPKASMLLIFPMIHEFSNFPGAHRPISVRLFDPASPASPDTRFSPTSPSASPDTRFSPTSPHIATRIATHRQTPVSSGARDSNHAPAFPGFPGLGVLSRKGWVSCLRVRKGWVSCLRVRKGWVSCLRVLSQGWVSRFWDSGFDAFSSWFRRRVSSASPKIY